MNKNVVYGAMGAAGLVALLAILDMALKIPFGGFSMTMDILYTVAALVVLYMGWDTTRDMN